MCITYDKVSDQPIIWVREIDESEIGQVVLDKVTILVSSKFFINLSWFFYQQLTRQHEGWCFTDASSVLCLEVHLKYLWIAVHCNQLDEVASLDFCLIWTRIFWYCTSGFGIFTLYIYIYIYIWLVHITTYILILYIHLVSGIVTLSIYGWLVGVIYGWLVSPKEWWSWWQDMYGWWHVGS